MITSLGTRARLVASRPSRAFGVVVVVLLVIGCGAGTDEAADSVDEAATTTTAEAAVVDAACQLMYGADASEVADPVEAQGLIDALLQLQLRSAMPGDAVVYLEPAMAGELTAVAEELASVASVEVLQTADQDAAYEVFVERFSDSEELIEAVRPVDLPPWVDVRVDSESAHPTLEPFKDDPRVREIIFRDDVERETGTALRQMATRFAPELAALSADAPPTVRRGASALLELSADEGDSDNVDQVVDAARTLSSFFHREC